MAGKVLAGVREDKIDNESQGPGVTGDRNPGKWGAKFRLVSGVDVKNYGSEALQPQDWGWANLLDSSLWLFSTFLEGGTPTPSPSIDGQGLVWGDEQLRQRECEVKV